MIEMFGIIAAVAAGNVIAVVALVAKYRREQAEARAFRREIVARSLTKSDVILAR